MIKLRKVIRTTILDFIHEQTQHYPILDNNFKSWFSKSKITEDGHPLICYHGSSDANIKIFDINKIGINKGNFGHYGYGFYFSNDIREAKGYGPYIYKCYIKMENPFFGDDEQILQLKNNGVKQIDNQVILSIDFNSFKNAFKNNNLVFEFLNNLEHYGVEYAWNIAHDKKVEPNEYDILNDIHQAVEYTTLNKHVNGVPDYVIDELKNWNIHPVLNKGFNYHQSLHWITDLGNRSKEVTEVIKNLGYDGVYYGSEIVVFNPNQIKSINNDGSWDINDNNIYS